MWMWLRSSAVSSAIFSRSRRARATSHWRSGTVRAVSRISTSSADTAWTPHTCGSSRITPFHSGSCHISMAVASISSRTRGMSLVALTG
jgi:hypothetical protein